MTCNGAITKVCTLRPKRGEFWGRRKLIITILHTMVSSGWVKLGTWSPQDFGTDGLGACVPLGGPSNIPTWDTREPEDATAEGNAVGLYDQVHLGV